MSRRLAIGCLLWLTVILVAESATAIVYIPGQYRDGVYVRPHFRESAEGASKQDWLQRFGTSSTRKDQAADAKLPPAKPDPGPKTSSKPAL